MSNLPSSLSYTESDIRDASLRDELAFGWYRFKIGSAETKEAESSGSLMIVLKCYPLKDPDDADSATTPFVRHNLIMPTVNPNRDGHKKPNTVGMNHSFLRALSPEGVPDYPRRVDGVFMFQDAEIEPGEQEEARMQVTTSVFERLDSLYQEPQQLIDEVFYAELYQNGDFLNLKNIRHDLPDDASLVPAGEMKVKRGREEKAAAMASTSSNGSSHGTNGSNGAKNGTAKAVKTEETIKPKFKKAKS